MESQALLQQQFSNPIPNTFIEASQYSYHNPGSFQSINGKMYFFPAIVQTPPEYGKVEGSPYPLDWKFLEPKNQPMPTSGAQMYHAQGFTNTAPAGKPYFVENISPQSLGELSVHFTDSRLNQETMIQYEQTTVKEGEDSPNYPLDFKAFIPGQQGMQMAAQPMQHMQHLMPPPQTTYAMPPTKPPFNLYPPPPQPHVMPPGPLHFHNYVSQQQAMNPLQKYPSLQSAHFMNRHHLAPPSIIQHEREVVHYVPKVENKIVERDVYVPGDQKIFVPQPFNADTYCIVPKYEDTEIKFVVSESFVPEIHESEDVIEVEVSKYEPDIQYVDIYVPRPIAIPIKATGEYEQFETPSKKISQKEFQYSMEGINPHLKEIENYNMINENIFKKYIEHAREIAASHQFEPPEPIYYQNTPSLENEPTTQSLEYPTEDEVAQADEDTNDEEDEKNKEAAAEQKEQQEETNQPEESKIATKSST